MGNKDNRNKQADETRYFHGGFPGLNVGDHILSPERSSISFREHYEFYDPKRIFVTTSLDLATAFALSFARRAPTLDPAVYSGPALGTVYEVKLSGPKVPDEDWSELSSSPSDQFSFSVLAYPRITKVVIADLKPDSQREYRLFAPYETWESPDEKKVYPMWTEDGYMIPNPRDAANGITWQWIEAKDHMGPYPGKDMLIQKGYYIV